MIEPFPWRPPWLLSPRKTKALTFSSSYLPSQRRLSVGYLESAQNSTVVLHWSDPFPQQHLAMAGVLSVVTVWELLLACTGERSRMFHCTKQPPNTELPPQNVNGAEFEKPWSSSVNVVQYCLNPQYDVMHLTEYLPLRHLSQKEKRSWKSNAYPEAVLNQEVLLGTICIPICSELTVQQPYHETSMILSHVTEAEAQRCSTSRW